MLNLHFNQLMIIGLLLLPGSFVVAFLLAVVFRSQEIGAVAIAGAGWVITLVAGVALFLVGLGMELH